MNFRSLRYFQTVCEMGTVSAAARKLYISQQSLSQNIKKLEEELGLQLFHRDNPLTLTEAGKCVWQTANDVLARMDRMDHELTALRGELVPELTIGMLDYGIPDFMPPLLGEFVAREPKVLLRTREIPAGEAIPPDIPLLISARELGGHYKSELLLSDRLVVCVSDSLLRQQYGERWKDHKQQLARGDLAALAGCPFVRHRNTPLEALSDMVFAQNRFSPEFLPVMGSVNAIAQFCIGGKAAMVALEMQAKHDVNMPPVYRINNVPETVPAGYICYRSDGVLSNTAQRFLDITRRYFKRSAQKYKHCRDSRAE